MAIPYTSGDFTSARVVDHWLEYPFTDFDDRTTKVYNLRCRVNVADYTSLPKGTLLSSAAAAGVIDTPFTDSTARFIGDTPANSVSGGVVEFVRSFAKIPKKRIDYSTTVFTNAPTFASKTEPTLFETTTGAVSRQRRFEYVVKPSKSEVIPVRIEYKYTTTPTSAALFTEEGFEIQKTDSTTSIVNVGGNLVLEVDEGSSTIIPTGDSGVAESTKISQWRGDIYEVATGYRI